MVNYTIANFALLVVTIILLLVSIVLIVVKIVVAPTTDSGVSGTSMGFIDAQQSQNIYTDQTFTNQPEMSLTADMIYQNLTLDNCTIQMNGFRIFADTLQLLNGVSLLSKGNNGGMNNTLPNALVCDCFTGGILRAGGKGGAGCFNKNGEDGEGSSSCLFDNNQTNEFQGLGGFSNLIKEEKYGNTKSLGFEGGKSGFVKQNLFRCIEEVKKALDLNYQDVSRPLLSGGSGGGGGCGTIVYPGSAGGNGGSSIVIVAKRILCPLAEKRSAIDVSGGNGGILFRNGPLKSTSGGGGGGGLILMETNSPKSDFEGLDFEYKGGSCVDTQGKTVYAKSGRLVFWND